MVAQISFKIWLEANQELIDRLKKAVLDVYGAPISTDALVHYSQKTDEELERVIHDLETNEKQKVALRKQQQSMMQQKQDMSLHTDTDSYERIEQNETRQRVVCSKTNPLFEKRGMPAFAQNVLEADAELKGYYGVHVGDADEWLPVMARDGYCDGDAYVYDIMVGQSRLPFYEMEDYHIMVKGEEPSGWIIFSKYKKIPATLIKLVEVIQARKIKPAPDKYDTY